ncbi:MAG: hypothetical protein EPN75_01345 [Beijerinckiaceae bacterium]|nr:MAG: hypothetical protein EPN75_01345 [Beijerinckiaceae bacterium]
MDHLEKTQSKRTWRIDAVFPYVLLAAAYGLLFSRFLPSNHWAIEALYADGVIFLVVFSGMIAGRIECGGRIRGIRNRWMRALVTAVGLSLFGYYAVAVDCGQLLNYFIGIKTNENHLVTGWSLSTAKACAHPNIDNRFFPNSALCRLPYSKEQVPPGTVLRLYGRVSWLGIQIESAKIVQPVHLPNTCCELFPPIDGFELQMPSENGLR